MLQTLFIKLKKEKKIKISMPDFRLEKDVGNFRLKKCWQFLVGQYAGNFVHKKKNAGKPTGLYDEKDSQNNKKKSIN